jgi:hypothetical protein
MYPFFKDYYENILTKNENSQTYFKCFFQINLKGLTKA